MERVDASGRSPGQQPQAFRRATRGSLREQKAVAARCHLQSLRTTSENRIMQKTWVPALLAGLFLAAASLPGQTPAAALTFDVASIKPSEPITPAMVQAGRIHA